MAISPPSTSRQRARWAFWVMCALSAIASLQLLVVGGGSNRLGAPVISFAIAAVASGACALLYTRGRQIASLLYFLASLAIVYGALAMVTLPLRLAVIGTCPAAPAACGPGLERQLTNGESTALGLAIALGIAAILAGYFGLATLRLRDARPLTPPVPPTRGNPPVPVRRIPPVVTRTPAPVESVTPEASAPPTPVTTESEPAPEPMLELAAPAEALELPAAGIEDPAEAAPAAPTEAPPSAPAPRPRRRRGPKSPAPSNHPPTGGSD
ncbi:MAG: hypothetical protein ACHQQS_18765 [Thermoanaerobaculales bacterium]